MRDARSGVGKGWIECSGQQQGGSDELASGSKRWVVQGEQIERPRDRK